MSEEKKGKEPMESLDLKSLIREVIQEYVSAERSEKEPAYKAELMEERRRREALERRVNELIAENERARRAAAEVERASAIKEELRRLGVVKVDLAFRAVKDDIVRAEDGRLVAKTAEGELPMQEYLARFVRENPELLPARIPGGSGASAGEEGFRISRGIDLNRIRPGMDPEELEEARKQIAEVISQALKGA